MSKIIATHGGTYHPDEVFAVATLLLIYPDSKIIRTRDESIIANADIAVDVGEQHSPEANRFDHHQKEGAGIRENGVPYASFGLVWNQFGEWLAGSKEGKEIIEEKLVMPVDAIDNGISPSVPVFDNVQEYNINNFLYSFLDARKHDEAYLYDVFMQVVNVAKDLITREVRRTTEKIRNIEKVRAALKSVTDKRIIVLNEELPWERVVVPIEEARFVVFPTREGRWAGKSVPTTIAGFERRVYFPTPWVGKSGKELSEITGVGDACFCHRDGFFVSALSKKGALALVEKALNN